MPYDEEEIERVLAEEQPGPAVLQSALFEETLQHAASRPSLCVETDATLAETLRQMRENGHGSVLVMAGGKLVGIFTERDVLMKIAGHPIDAEKVAVKEYMTADPVTLPSDSNIAYALNKMVVEGFRHIPVVDAKGQPIGVVSMRDLIEFVAELYSKEVLDLPPEPRAGFRDREGS